MYMGGRDSIKVEIFFAAMLLDVNFLSTISRHRGERGETECEYGWVVQ